MKRLLYLNNASSTFFSHRIGWARAARQAGWSVTVAGPFSGEEARRLREEGWAVEPFALTRGVGRPTDELRTFARLRALLAFLLSRREAGALGEERRQQPRGDAEQ